MLRYSISNMRFMSQYDDEVSCRGPRVVVVSRARDGREQSILFEL